MGNIVCLINETVDGFCDSNYVIADAEFHEFVHGLLDNAAAVGFGRHSFELFEGVWPPMLSKPEVPASQLRMARRLGEIEKIAFSSSERVRLPGTTAESCLLFSLSRDICFFSVVRNRSVPARSSPTS